LHVLGTHQRSSLQLIYHLCPLHAPAFEDTPQPNDQAVRTCCKEICFALSALLFMDLLDFTFIEFDFFLSFLCVTSAVTSADVNLSARN
jgi:hypothetical protein